MADAFTTIGWLFQAKDMASGVVTKAATTVQKASKTVTKGVETTSEVIDEMSRSVVASLTPAAQTIQEKVASSFKAATATVKSGMPAIQKAVAVGVGGIKTTAGTIGDSVAELTTMAVGGLSNALTGAFSGAMKSGKSFFGFLGGRAVNTMKSLQATAVSAGANFGKVFSIFGGMGDLVKSFGKMGFLGAFLGPLAPLLKLLTPIINLLTDLFEPFIETFVGVIKNALGPTKEILEIVAVTLGKKISKMIGPLTVFMELAAVQLANIVMSLLKGNRGGTQMSRILKGVMEILPILFRAGVKLGKAIWPLAKVLGKLAFTVLEKALIPGLKNIAIVIEELVVPAIKFLVDKIYVPFYKFINDSLSKFFKDWRGNLRSFYDMFIKPMVDWLKNFWPTYIQPIVDKILGFGAKIWKALGIGPAIEGMKGAFQALMRTIELPLISMKNFVNSWIIDPINSLLKWNPPGPIGVVGSYFGYPKGIPELAQGGIVTGETEAIVGEAGREMVLPLKPETVQRNLGPLLPQIDLDPFMQIIERIEMRLGGILRVQVVGGGEGNSMSASVGGTNAPVVGVESAVGLMGV